MSTIFRKVVYDPSRFEGSGISYKAKLIGIEDVKEARGDLMCQEALIKLKNSVKISGHHKKKIFVNVTLEGLKIIDAISLASVQNKKKNEPKSPKLGEGNDSTEQRQDLIVLHTHPVHRISFISRDTTDTRAFGYVFGTEDGLHKFFAIKTATAAEHLVLALRDLFQVVYEMKKKEMETAKSKLENEEITVTSAKENLQSSGAGSTSGTSQTPVQKVNADTENIYQVPTNNAPVKPETRAEQVANLLDLEDQAEHILKGIEQIKNLEFDSVTNDTFPSSTSLSTSPLTKLTPSPPSAGVSDDTWGLYSTPSVSSSQTLGNMGGLQAGPFPAMSQQSFASTNFPMQTGSGGSPGFNMMNSGLPFTKDPFGNDPFGSPAQQARIPAAPGFGIGSGFNQHYGMNSVPRLNIMGAPGMMPGMVPHRMMSAPIIGSIHNPYVFQQSPGFPFNPFDNNSANILQPMKKDAGPDPNAASPEPVKIPSKTRGDLFGDLLEIKKSSSSTARSPKDLFAQINAPEKKPMNEMIGPGKPVKSSIVSASQSKQLQASGVTSDPFGDLDSVILDKTRGLLLSASGEDPFDTSHIPYELTESSTYPTHSIKSANACTTPPPVPSRQPSLFNCNTDTTTSSPMPSCSPPPPPTMLSQPTLPLPCRTAFKAENTTDINENINPSSFDFNFLHDSNTSLILPPPDDPPPLLPPHLAIQPPSFLPPSPTTPRPNVKFAQKLSNITHKEHNDISEEHKTISKSSYLNDTASLQQNTNTSYKGVCFKSQSSDFLDVYENKDCVSFATIDFQASKNSTLDRSSSLTEISCSQYESSSHQVFESKSNKLEWVGFENLPENSRNFSFPTLRSVSDKDDPFNMPLRLAPGFKAVAKFGSDPFDDSLSGPFSNNVWQPFSTDDHDSKEVNHDSPLSSPFGDAFVTSTQQGANKSLFD